MLNLSVTAEHTKAYVLCSRTSSGVFQWTGESQEDKLDCYCAYCGVYISNAVVRSKWGLDLNRTELDPRSSPVQGPVQKNHNFWVGSGSGFTLGRTCCEPGLD